MDPLLIKYQKTKLAQKILQTNKQKDKVGELTFSNLKFYPKAAIILTMWSWHKDRHTAQWNGTESPGVNTHFFTVTEF